MPKVKTYQFDSPYDWLAQTACDWTPEQLYQTLLQLALIAGNDELQDLFQQEMADDGYFDEFSPAELARQKDPKEIKKSTRG